MKGYKKFFSLSLVCAMLFSLAACGETETAATTEGDATQEVIEVTVASGTTSGSQYQWGVAACNVVNSHSDLVQLNPITTTGTTESLALVASGDADLGILSPQFQYCAQEGILSYEGNQITNLQSVYATYPTYMVPCMAADAPWDCMQDLIDDHVRFSVDTAGNSLPKTQLLRDGLGIDYEEAFDILNLSLGDSCDAVSAGTCDVFLTCLGKGGSAPTELAAGPTGIKYIGYTQEELDKITSNLPLYKAVKYQDFGLDYEVDVVAAFGYLVANTDVPEIVSYEIARCLTEYNDELVAAVASAEGNSTAEATIDNIFSDYAPGAEKYFKENGYLN